MIVNSENAYTDRHLADDPLTFESASEASVDCRIFEENLRFKELSPLNGVCVEPGSVDEFRVRWR